MFLWFAGVGCKHCLISLASLRIALMCREAGAQRFSRGVQLLHVVIHSGGACAKRKGQ